MDAVRVVKNALRKRGLYKGARMPKLRTDNGPQFIAKKFQETCEKLGIIHERIPVYYGSCGVVLCNRGKMQH
jgi:transposase InsO family protein